MHLEKEAITMATNTAIKPARDSLDNSPKPDTAWPHVPDPLKDYYHDYHVYDQSGQPLFISAALTSCSMNPTSSHETILPNSCPHKTPLLYFEFSHSVWNHHAFDEKTGRRSCLSWSPNIDVKSLAHLNFKSLAKHSVISTPSRVFTARPSAIFGICPPFADYLIYPEGLDHSLPIFRPTDPEIATHLFVKIPWRPKSTTPEHIEIVLRTRLTGLHYWSAINDYYRIGVDYWLVPISEKPSML